MNSLLTVLSAVLVLSGDFSNKISNDSTVIVQNQKPLVSFGIIADVQYADQDPAGTRHYRESYNKLRQSLWCLKNDSVDFIVTLGDLIDRDIESYNPLLRITDSSGLKFFHIPGNHDYSLGKTAKKRIPSSYLKKPGYYFTTHHNYRFIFLNGNELSLYASDKGKLRLRAQDMLDSLRSNGALNAQDWNGGLSRQQMGWLDRQLTDASLKDEKVFIFCHFPVYPENIHNLLNDKEVLKCLERHNNIIAWFNGHNHAGNYGNKNAVHYVTIKGMVETKDENSYARVDVYSNKIWIVGSGREKSKILAY